MNYKITFEEMSKRCKEVLAKQKPVTIEQARAQVQWLKDNSKIKERKTPS